MRKVNLTRRDMTVIFLLGKYMSDESQRIGDWFMAQWNSKASRNVDGGTVAVITTFLSKPPSRSTLWPDGYNDFVKKHGGYDSSINDTRALNRVLIKLRGLNWLYKADDPDLADKSTLVLTLDGLFRYQELLGLFGDDPLEWPDVVPIVDGLPKWGDKLNIMPPARP